MVHYYEKNIVEIKKEYTDFLLDILTPILYEGLLSIYSNCVEYHKKLLVRNRNSKKTNSLLKIFQTRLAEIPELSTNKIEQEVLRIKESSKCSDWFDDLIKAIIKSNILLLTFSGESVSDIVNKKHHETINTNDFIHKCYIQCASNFYNDPYLFWHEYSPVDIKKNQKRIQKIIKKSIKVAIQKMLPIKQVLREYLENDYVIENTENSEDSRNKIRDIVFQVLDETGINNKIDHHNTADNYDSNDDQYISDIQGYNFNKNGMEWQNNNNIPNDITPILSDSYKDSNKDSNKYSNKDSNKNSNKNSDNFNIAKKGSKSLENDSEFQKATKELVENGYNVVFEPPGKRVKGIVNDKKGDKKENYFASMFQ